ncbi:hypothetical protein ACL2XK_03035 [Sodalis sp. RH23]
MQKIIRLSGIGGGIDLMTHFTHLYCQVMSKKRIIFYNQNSHRNS